MTRTLTIALTDTEMNLLLKQSALGCRRPQEQARYLLRSILLENGGQFKENLSANANDDTTGQGKSVVVAA